MTYAKLIWCRGGAELAQLLARAFGQANVLVRSPYHLQVRQQESLHNIWIDGQLIVKYRLSGQAGGAVISRSSDELLRAIRQHASESTDLSKMRQALELPVLIDAAKKAMPLSGLSRAVFVDAGFANSLARIGVVMVAMEEDGEHVRAESRPVTAPDSESAEEAAIEFAVSWVARDMVIFSDCQNAVRRAQLRHGDRIRWLPREHNRCADQVASLRNKKKRKKRRRRGAKPDSSSHPK